MLDLSLTIPSAGGGKPAVLANPVCVASGAYGFGTEYAPLVDNDSLGAIFSKAVTLEPRAGNPVPRLQETPAGLLNSIGLANPGLAGFEAGKLAELSRFRCARFVNVAGSTEDEYAAVLERLEDLAGIDGYEINISCPNVKHGGMAFGTDCFQVERLVARLRAIAKRPLVVKLSPNVTDIAAVAKAAVAGGADALSAINTVVGMAIDIRRKRPVIPMGTAGLSGPAIKPIGLACVYKVARAVSVPVIGVGGISSWSDAVEYLLAGARAVQIGTGLFADPSLPAAVLAGLRKYMEEEGLSSIADFAEAFREGEKGAR